MLKGSTATVDQLRTAILQRLPKAVAAAAAADTAADTADAAAAQPQPAAAADATATSAASAAPVTGTIWDPPVGKYAKPGATRVFPQRGKGIYWPRMPCLRCGCPWWQGEDWDANCMR